LADTKDCSAILKTADSLYYSNPDSSYQLSIIAEKCAINQHDKLSLATALSYQGRHFLLKSDLEASNLKLNEALGIYRELTNFKGIAYILKLKSNLQRRIGNLDEAIALHEESIENYKKANSIKGVNSVLLNLTLDYFSAKDYLKAEQALQEIEKNIDSLSLTNTYFYHQNKGLLYKYTSKLIEAIEEFKLALKIAQSNKMIDSEATALLNLGSSYRLYKDFKQAQEALHNSKTIAIKHNLDHELVETYNELILLYQDLGNFKDAYYYLKLTNDLNNKILNIEKINKIAFLEKKLAVSEKEKQIEGEKIKAEHAKSQTKKLIYILIAITLILLFTIYLFLKTRKLKNKIANQHQKLEEKNIIIEEKNKDITDSIRYAKRIQEAILPADEMVQNLLPNSFVLYKPKDIVSGDIYWIEKWGKHTLVAAVDCTGHGVPGAFMSIVAANLLNEAVVEHSITQPAAILNSVRKNLIKKLRKSNTDESIKDGMDASLIAIHEETNTLEFSGAFNPLWLIRNNELTEYKADKLSIGISHTENQSFFTNHQVKLEKNDVVYIFTDGYADQFGGPQGKKFKYKQLKELLLKNVNLSMNEQKLILDTTIEKWKGELEQVDDILIIGIKF